MVNSEGMRCFPLVRSRERHWLKTGAVLMVLGWVLCQCSLNFEDPAQEARDKLAKVVPTRFELLVGRWIGDSTYTADDTRATGLGHAPVRLELFPDTSYAQSDSGKSAFPSQRAQGVYFLHADTLILVPLSAAPDTFIVHMRFLGNYLEMVRVSDQRYTFFHKVKPRGGEELDSLLTDSLWSLRGQRVAPGTYRSEPLTRDFSYLRFHGDSLFADRRVNGVIRLDSGPLVRDGRQLSWEATGGKREFLADMTFPDSLRLWPLHGGLPDSGWSDWVRVGARHSRDIDMRRAIGHLRGDSLRDTARGFEYHYGRYYDWNLGEDHTVRVETNMAGVPLWTSWSLDSGFLSLAATGRPPQRMRVDTAGGRLHFRIDTGAYFPARTVYSATLVAGDFAAKPLDRFQKASYLILKTGSDSLAYFFNASNQGDRYEIDAGPTAASRWAGFVLPRAQETFQSGQEGFFLAFSDSTRAHGRFTCRSRAARALAIRQTSSDPLFAAGFIQGACVIQQADSAFADSAFADSVFAIEGSFKILRADRGGFANPGWSLR
jgi:hypothetical protein